MVTTDDPGPQLRECRWSWCRAVLQNNRELIEHLREHVAKAIPVRRGDIQLLRLAEDGVGESMQLCELGSTLNPPMESSKLSAHSPFLPPLSRSTTPDIDEHAMPFDPIEHHFSNQLLLRPDSPIARASLKGHPTSETQRASARTPTFTSLSSPMHNSSFPPIPDSPSFDSLVSDATRMRSNPIRKPSAVPFDASMSSRSSSGSVSFIEKHLTQSPSPHPEDDLDFEKPCIPSSAESMDVRSSPTTNTPTKTLSRVAETSPLAPSVIRQAWYGFLPKRRKSHSHHRTLSSQSSGLKSPDSSQFPHGHEGISRSTQARVFPSASPEFVEPPELSDAHPFEDSDPLALLQTQAPYQSQSQASLV